MMEPRNDSRVRVAPRTRTDAMFSGVERFPLTYGRDQRELFARELHDAPVLTIVQAQTHTARAAS